MVLVIRWFVAVASALVWLGFWVLGMVSAVQRENEFSRSPFYHLSILFGILAVVVLPVGDYLDRAPFALISVAPEIVWPLDILLDALGQED